MNSDFTIQNNICVKPDLWKDIKGTGNLSEVGGFIGPLHL